MLVKIDYSESTIFWGAAFKNCDMLRLIARDGKHFRCIASPVRPAIFVPSTRVCDRSSLSRALMWQRSGSTRPVARIGWFEMGRQRLPRMRHKCLIHNQLQRIHGQRAETFRTAPTSNNLNQSEPPAERHPGGRFPTLPNRRAGGQRLSPSFGSIEVAPSETPGLVASGA